MNRPPNRRPNQPPKPTRQRPPIPPLVIPLPLLKHHVPPKEHPPPIYHLPPSDFYPHLTKSNGFIGQDGLAGAQGRYAPPTAEAETGSQTISTKATAPQDLAPTNERRPPPTAPRRTTETQPAPSKAGSETSPTTLSATQTTKETRRRGFTTGRAEPGRASQTHARTKTERATTGALCRRRPVASTQAQDTRTPSQTSCPTRRREPTRSAGAAVAYPTAKTASRPTNLARPATAAPPDTATAVSTAPKAATVCQPAPPKVSTTRETARPRSTEPTKIAPARTDLADVTAEGGLCRAKAPTEAKASATQTGHCAVAATEKRKDKKTTTRPPEPEQTTAQAAKKTAQVTKLTRSQGRPATYATYGQIRAAPTTRTETKREP